ncbi:antA/AntB antirepressor family protein [Flavobacterium psychrophilum]|uniref:antA/AntB antirepressor family protein n=1 Tax=Flavobacterium psychrophilum TaxID=96345 RepID=UPI00061878D0|nr:antA/AntB antirepressor family protein [Flavobacterium psychrophilum]OAE94003.1 hypothetical protein SU65_01460 [Flavobacterium psychrophilum]
MDLQIITTDHEGKQPIDARKLYLSLGYQRGKFNRWSKTNIEDNPYFFEGTDWCKVETIIFDDDANFENFENDDFDDDFQKNNSTDGIVENENNRNNRPDGEPKRSYQKKDFALTFDMAYHLTLQSNTPIAHEVRQALINQKKATALKEKQIISLTQEDITDTERYENVKNINRESAKEMRFLEVKAKKRKETLNNLILGKAEISTTQKLQNQSEQLNLFDSNKKQLE